MSRQLTFAYQMTRVNYVFILNVGGNRSGSAAWTSTAVPLGRRDQTLDRSLLHPLILVPGLIYSIDTTLMIESCQIGLSGIVAVEVHNRETEVRFPTP